MVNGYEEQLTTGPAAGTLCGMKPLAAVIAAVRTFRTEWAQITEATIAEMLAADDRALPRRPMSASARAAGR